MSLKEKLKRSLGFSGSTEKKENSSWQKWYDEQIRRLEAGEEIEPPWIFAPNEEPWSMS